MWAQNASEWLTGVEVDINRNFSIKNSTHSGVNLGCWNLYLYIVTILGSWSFDMLNFKDYEYIDSFQSYSDWAKRECLRLRLKRASKDDSVAFCDEERGLLERAEFAREAVRQIGEPVNSGPFFCCPKIVRNNKTGLTLDLITGDDYDSNILIEVALLTIRSPDNSKIFVFVSGRPGVYFKRNGRKWIGRPNVIAYDFPRERRLLYIPDERLKHLDNRLEEIENFHVLTLPANTLDRRFRRFNLHLPSDF